MMDNLEPERRHNLLQEMSAGLSGVDKSVLAKDFGLDYEVSPDSAILSFEKFASTWYFPVLLCLAAASVWSDSSRSLSFLGYSGRRGPHVC